jgi:Leucine-rich repeat (LRR) protein
LRWKVDDWPAPAIERGNQRTYPILIHSAYVDPESGRVLRPWLGSLTALTELYLPNNKLTGVPADLGNLTALRRLFLFNNRLTSLPPELGNLTALTDLYLHYNQLTSVPAELGGAVQVDSIKTRVEIDRACVVSALAIKM